MIKYGYRSKLLSLENHFLCMKQGALKYNEMKAENYVNTISVKEASAKYLAGSHITPDMPMPTIDGINDLLKEDIKQYGMWLEQIVYNSGSRLIAAKIIMMLVLNTWNSNDLKKPWKCLKQQ